MKKRYPETIQRREIWFQWIRFFVVGYASSFAIGQIFYGNIIFSCVFGLSIVLFVERYQKYLTQKRATLLRNQFCDLLYSLSASFATGRQLSSALQDAYINLGYVYKHQSPIMEELKHMTKSMQENLESEEVILSGFAKRSGVEDIQNFVNVYLSCRVTGGDMNRVITNASQVLMQKMLIEREIRVMTSQKRFEGKIISVMPILVIVFLNLTSPGYLDNLYHTVAGRVIMTIAMMGIWVAYILTEKITNIEG